MTDEEFQEALKGDLESLSPLIGYLEEIFPTDPARGAARTHDLAKVLSNKERYSDISRVYYAAALANHEDRSYRDRIHKELESLLSGDAEQRVFVRHSDFGNRRLKAAEPVRRLMLLQQLAPGTMVYDRKSWGFGVVTAANFVEEKIQVDFNSRPGHQLALNYAAEILDVLDDSHILARNHHDSAAVQQQIADEPGAFVVDLLRSFGPRSAPLLQELIVPEFVPEAGWKKFWDAARKQLKKNPLVEFPAKRNDPLLLLEEEKSYDTAWFERLSINSDMKSILASVQEFIDNRDKKADLPENAKDVLANRLGFVVHGSEGQDNALTVRALLLAHHFDLPAEEVQATGFVQGLHDGQSLLRVLGDLPARDLRELLAYLVERDPETTLGLLLSLLNQFEYTAASEAIALLRKRDREKDVADLLRGYWNRWDISSVLLYWFCNNLDCIEEWDIGQLRDIGPRLLRVIDGDFGGDRLRTINQIKALFATPSWLKEIMGDMDTRQRRQFTQGVKDSSAWESLDKASVLGQIVKIDGDMKDIVSGRHGRSSEAEAPTRGPITSHRSFAQRQKTLDKIVKEDIPQNSQDIATAREYGDLRENFEYKAAKDQQRILMQRQGELEQMLRTVVPTDFEGFPSDNVGVATEVRIRYADGREETYFILGEWDSDEELGIISCNSRMALALENSVAGDEVTIPAIDGEAHITVTYVGALPDNIREWVKAPA